jgi:uncharacterized Fe-S cluster-containing radical SAM superfamily protein
MSPAEEMLRDILDETRRIAGSGLADDLARHAASLAGAGASIGKIIDEALLFLLHRGESHALKKGAGTGDSLGVRPLVVRYRDYAGSIKAALGETPDYFRNRRKNLQAFVTRRCNLRCSYCPVRKCERTMEPRVLAGSLDFLLSSGESSVRFDFSGGEPLYAADLVLRTCGEGLERAAALGKDLSFYMVTNGTLMDRETARKLAALPMFLEISMDGSEAFHNRCKIPVDRAVNPYLATRRAVNLMLEEGTGFFVVMVATPETAPHLAENFEHVLSTGVRNVDINYSIGRFWTRPALRTFLSQIAAILERHRGLIDSGRLCIGNLDRRVEPSILNAEWIVDTDGSIHMMTEWVFQTTFEDDGRTPLFGNVLDGTPWGEMYADRFQAYLTLLECAGWRDAKLRKIIHNNIEVGRRVKEFFALGSAARSRSA